MLLFQLLLTATYSFQASLSFMLRESSITSDAATQSLDGGGLQKSEFTRQRCCSKLQGDMHVKHENQDSALRATFLAAIRHVGETQGQASPDIICRESSQPEVQACK